LGPDECILSSDFAEKHGVKIGEQVAFPANYMDVFKTIANVWNSRIVDNPDRVYVDPNLFYRDDRADVFCTVRGFSSDGNGKFPLKYFTNKVIVNDF